MKVLSFICKPVKLKVENHQTMFSSAFSQGQTITVPVAHGEGNYYCDEQTLAKLKANNQIVFYLPGKSKWQSGKYCWDCE